MMALAVGACSFVLVLRLFRFKWLWPWRATNLSISSDFGLTSPMSSSTRRSYPRGSQQPSRKRPHGPEGRRAQSDIDRSIPLTADLLVVAVSAGHSIHTAIEAVSRFDTGPTGMALAQVWQRFEQGSVLGDELRCLPNQLGETLRPLCNTLISAIGSGAPLEPSLMRLADAERRRQRRRTEERIRRLPILMLAPLVVFILPSFVLLSIVPVLITSIDKAGL